MALVLAAHDRTASVRDLLCLFNLKEGYSASVRNRCLFKGRPVFKRSPRFASHRVASLVREPVSLHFGTRKVEVKTRCVDAFPLLVDVV